MKMKNGSLTKRYHGFGKLALCALLLMLLCALAVSAAADTLSEEDRSAAIVLTDGSPAEVSITAPGGYQIFSFTPDEDQEYVYYSTSNTDTYGYLFDSEGNQITYDDDGGKGNNFQIISALKANEEYFLKARFYSASNTGSFEVCITGRTQITGMDLSALDGIELYPGESLRFAVALTPETIIWHEPISFSSECDICSISENSDGTYQIYAYNSGTETIRAYLSANPEINAQATVTIHSLAEVESTALALNETVNATLDATETFEMYSFVPAEDGKYYFETSDVEHGIYLRLYDAEWNQINSYGYMSSGSRWFQELTGGQTYHIQATYDKSSHTSDQYGITVGINIPVSSINLESLDGMSFYPGEWKDFIYSVLPENATNQYVSFRCDSSELDFSTYSSDGEHHVEIYGQKSGEYTITAYSQDDSSITATATVTVLSLADVESTELTLDEPATVSISEAGTFKMFSFTPDENAKYYIETSQVSVSDGGAYIQLYDQEWNRIQELNYLYNGSRRYYELNAGETYYFKAKLTYNNYTGSYNITVGKVIPVTSITLDGLDGMELYQGDWKTFTWTVEPENATDQRVYLTDYDGSALDYSTYGSNENRIRINAKKSGEYTVTAYSVDNPELREQATIKILSLADVESTELTLNETVNASITAPSTFNMYSFTPEETGKYYFETSNVNHGMQLTLYDEEWNRIGSYGYVYDYRWFHELEKDKTYHLQVKLDSSYTSGTYEIAVGLNIPVQSITLEGIDGMELYPGDWKDFTWTVEPANATNQRVYLTDYDSSKLNYSNYGANENRIRINAYKSGEYTVTVYSDDNPEIRQQATIRILSLADVESTELTLNETVNASITAPATFNMYSFTPEETGKYYFETSNVDRSVYLTLYDEEWNRIGNYGYVNNYRWFHELEKDKTYHLQVKLDSSYTSGTYELAVGLNIPVQSITIEGLDGMELYPGDWKDFTWTVEPSNATNQQVWLDDYDRSKLDYTSYSNENRMDICAYQSGEYTVTVYSADNPEIRQQATIRILSLAEEESTELTLNEAVNASITAPATFNMYSFTPEEAGKYYFETSNVNRGVQLTLYDEEWNRIGSYGYVYDYRWFHELKKDKTYHLQVKLNSSYTSGTYKLAVGLNIPVQSITLEDLDGMELYPGDWKDFTWTVEPTNATNQRVYLTDYDSSKLNYSYIGANENRISIYAYKSGEYTVTVYSDDNPEIRQQATIRILSLADAPTIELTQGETASVEMCEAGTFQMFSFTPAETGKYFFRAYDADDDYDCEVYSVLYDAEWNMLNDATLYNSTNSRMFQKLEGGKTYYLKTTFDSTSYTGTIMALVDKSISVTSITFDGLDGIELYPGDWKTFTWTVEPANATNQRVYLTNYDDSALDYSTYSDENKIDIQAYKSGEYTVTAYSADNPEIWQQVTIKVLSLADAPTTEMTAGETTRVNIDEAGTFKVFSFKPDEEGKYYFETSNVSDGVTLILYDSEWNQLNRYTGMGNGSRRFDTLNAGTEYYIKASFSDAESTGKFDLTVAKSIPVESIKVEDLTLYVGDSGDDYFQISVLPENATNSEVWFDWHEDEDYYLEDYGYVEARKAGTYTVTAHASDNSEITDEVILTILPIDVSEAVLLNLDETATVSISEAGTFKVLSFKPSEAGKYYFETSNVDNGVNVDLYDSDWNRLKRYTSMRNGSRLFATLNAETEYYLKASFNNVESTGKFDLTVAQSIPVESIKVEDLTLFVGDSGEGYFQTSVLPENATNTYVWFNWHDKDDFYLETNGYIDAYKPGTYTVEAYADDDTEITTTATLTIINPGDAVEGALTLNKAQTVNIDTPRAVKVYSFTPEADGKYVFEIGNGLNTSIRLNLYDQNNSLMESVGLYNGNWFKALEGGKTYYIKLNLFGQTATGKFTLKVGDTIPVESIHVDDLTVIAGNIGGYFTSSVMPEDATNQSVQFVQKDNENFYLSSWGSVTGRKPGEYEISAYAADDESIVTTAKLTVVDIADVAGIPALTLNTWADSYGLENTRGTWAKFTPASTGKYAFKIQYAGYIDEDYEDYEFGYYLYERPENDALISNYAWENVSFAQELTGGKTYYVYVNRNSSVKVMVESYVPVTGISVEDMVLTVGDDRDIIYTVTPSNASVPQVRLQTMETDICRIYTGDWPGVYAQKAGTVTLTAYAYNDPTVTTTFKVTVVVPEASEAVALAMNTPTPAAGDKLFSFTAAENATYAFYSTGGGYPRGMLYDATFSEMTSDDGSGVAGNFLMTQEMKQGEIAYLRVDGYDQTCVVAEKYVPITALIVEDATIYSGETKQLSWTVVPENATPVFTYFYNVSNSFGYVREDGYAEGRMPGDILLTCRSGRSGVSTTATLTVLEPPIEATAALNGTTNVRIPAGGYKVIEFTPAQSGEYVFTSAGSNETLGTLYSSNWTVMSAVSTTTDATGNFEKVYALTKGKTYYLKVSFADEDVAGTTAITVAPNLPEGIPTIAVSKNQTTVGAPVTITTTVTEAVDYDIYDKTAGEVIGAYTAAASVEKSWSTVGDHMLVIRVKMGATGEMYETASYATVKVTAASIKGAVIADIAEVTYTGAEQTPAVTVTLNDQALVAGTDYTAAYTDNVNAGTATVTVTGKGNYKDSVSATFTIAAKALTDEMLTLEAESAAYTGAALTPAVAVKDGETVLTADADYTVAYTNNILPGEAKATVTGKGNYAGSIEKTFTITPADLSAAVITAAEGQVFTGSALEPAVTVALGEKTLTAEQDYEVAYGENINVGTGTITVTGKGNYTGTATDTFAIAQADLANAEIEPIAPMEHTGEELKPDVTVTLGGYTLIAGTDYTATYANNVENGTATVTLTGAGNFTGTNSATFTISAQVLKQEMVTIEPTTFAYDGTEKKPEVTVKAGEVILEADTAYTVAYENNINAGTKAKVTVTGTGDYQGSIVKYFTITAADLTGGVVSLAADAYEFTGAKIEPEVTVKLTAEGEALAAGTDYTVKYANNQAVGEATVTVTGKGNYAGTLETTFAITAKDVTEEVQITVDDSACVYTGEAVQPKVAVKLGDKALTEGTDYTVAFEENVSAGSGGKVKITLIGNYAGSVDQTFAIAAKPLSSSMLSLSGTSAVYDGNDHTPEITVKDGDKALTKDTDYTVEITAAEAERSDGVKAVGTYTVTVTGKGNYTGTATATFTINAIDLSGAEFSALEDKPYTGELITQPFTVTLNGAALTEGTDYSVSYYNNKNVGTATVTITGQGNYSGTASATFNILGLTIEDATITGVAESYTYTGSAITPTVVITYEESTLVEGTAYTVAYSDNINVGTATVTITGIRGFGGTKSITFQITPADIGTGAIAAIPDQTATGAALTPALTVTLNGSTLVAGTDYTVAYANNVNPGTATVTVTGQGNYTGTLSAGFAIQAAPATPTVDPATPTPPPTVPDTPVVPETPTPAPTMPSSVSDSTGSYSIGSDGATFSKPTGSSASVDIPDTITVNGQPVKVTAIADNAFKGNKKLTTVKIGKNIKTIGKNAFAKCAKLKTVKGGANVVTIKDGAFSGCKVLKTFPTMNKLQKIGANAFKGDKALAKFTLAKTVTSIGKNAFNGCAGLKTITVKTEKLTTKNVGAGAFKGINKKATFKCPKKQLKNYKTLFVKKGAPKTCKFK